MSKSEVGCDGSDKRTALRRRPGPTPGQRIAWPRRRAAVHLRNAVGSAGSSLVSGQRVDRKLKAPENPRESPTNRWSDYSNPAPPRQLSRVGRQSIYLLNINMLQHTLGETSRNRPDRQKDSARRARSDLRQAVYWGRVRPRSVDRASPRLYLSPDRSLAEKGSAGQRPVSAVRTGFRRPGRRRHRRRSRPRSRRPSRRRRNRHRRPRGRRHLRSRRPRRRPGGRRAW